MPQPKTSLRRTRSSLSRGILCSLLLLVPGTAYATDNSNSWWIPERASSQSSPLAFHSNAGDAERSDGWNSPRIYGGEITKVCEFPTTVAGRDACTGTLVHPRVVLSAAHCGRHREILIGEYKSKAAKRVKPKWCEMSSSSGSDAQICVLETAVEGLPLAPIIQGCEVEALKKGAKILLSGFGYDENDPVGNGSIRDEKRWVETKIVRVTGTEVHIGGGGKGGCNGDSGGPAFLQLDDGTWRTIGATHATVTGGAHPNCDVASWKRTDVLVSWYEKQLQKHGETDIDLTPCFNDQGSWEPTRECGGYTKDVQGPFGAWENNCGDGVPTVKYSATCGPAYSNEDNEAPEVEIVKPSTDFKVSGDDSFKVVVEASDDGEVESVTLLIDGQEIGQKDEEPYTWSIKDLEAGVHELQAEAEDNEGETAKSKVVRVEVESSDDDSEDDSDDGPDSGEEDTDDKNDSSSTQGEDSDAQDGDDDSAENDNDDTSEDQDGQGNGLAPGSSGPAQKGGCQLGGMPGGFGDFGALAALWALLGRTRRRRPN